VLAGAAVAILLATRFVVIPWQVEGASMEPALFDGDRVLVDLVSYRHRDPRAGEVVLLAGVSGEDLVKRIAPEPYPGRDPYPPPSMVPASALERSFVVLGDNADRSRDSRQFGRAPRHGIRGRVFWRYWPLSRMGPIE
jgi:signal peptidase I